MKKIAKFILTPLLVLVMLTTTFASIPVIIEETGPEVLVNNKRLAINALNKEARVLVPLRAIFESLNARVHYDNFTKNITGKKDGKIITLTVGDKVASINGEKVILDLPSQIVKDRTLVPVRFISEALGASVEWVNKTVMINSDKDIIDNWGIELTARNITPEGLTLVCDQSGGKSTGDLQTGSYYFLEEKIDNQWVPVEMIPSEDTRAWTDEAWAIPMDDRVEWELGWKDFYGELPTGYYRIGKKIADFRDTGDYDEKNYYADFEIVNPDKDISRSFTNKEIDKAIKLVENEFNFPAATLTKVWYDEEKSNKMAESYLKSGRGSINGVKFENVIVLLSNFDVDESGDNPVLNPGSTYTDYNWILIRDNKTSDWKIDDRGY